MRAAKNYAAKNGGAQLGPVHVDSSALYEGGEKPARLVGRGNRRRRRPRLCAAERTLDPPRRRRRRGTPGARRGSGVDALQRLRRRHPSGQNGQVDVRAVDLPTACA